MNKTTIAFALITTVSSLAFNVTSHAEDSNKTYSLQEVAQHKTEQDCWMAIEGKVYDLSKYLTLHPAGAGTMISWCGSDAEDGMHTKGIGDDHSPDAWKELNNFLIGTLK